ncbi:MAG: WecB/TagA/CpsF family glycosyltransferase [Rhodospirillales bacterium]
MVEVCRRSVAKGYRHFLYGGAPGVAKGVASNPHALFAGLTIVGNHAPPFRPLTPEEDDEVVRMMNASKTDDVWVGLSSPRQERWMAAHVGLPAAEQNEAAVDRGTSPNHPLDTFTQLRVCGSMCAAARRGFRMRLWDQGQLSLARPWLGVAGGCSSGWAESRVW